MWVPSFMAAPGLILPCFWGDLVFNSSRKKKLLDRYAESGVDLIGMILLIRKTWMGSYMIHFVYRIPVTGEVVVKSCKWLPDYYPESRSIPLKILRGYPNSGYPTLLLDRRDEDYRRTATQRRWTNTLFFGMVLASILLALATQCIVTTTRSNSHSTWEEQAIISRCQWRPVFIYPTMVLLCPLIGMVFSYFWFALFRYNLLYRAASPPPRRQLSRSVRQELDSLTIGAKVKATLLGPSSTTMVLPMIAENIPVDNLAQQIVHEAKMQSYQAIMDFLSTSSSCRGSHDNWHRRAYYVWLAARSWSDRTNLITLPSMECPDNAMGNLLQGLYCLYRARDIRALNQQIKGLSSTSISQDNIENDIESDINRTEEKNRVRQFLDMAHELLLRSAEQDPEDPTPWAALLSGVHMGLQVPTKTARQWFNNAIQRDPLHWKAHCGFFAYLCKKWGGSHKAMYGFARRSMIKAPKGSPLKLLLLQAFYEQYVWISSFERNSKQAMVFACSRAVQEETRLVYKEVLEHQHIGAVCNVEMHKLGIRWLYIACQREYLRKELLKIRPYCTKPWEKITYQGQDAFIMKLIRKELGGFD